MVHVGPCNDKFSIGFSYDTCNIKLSLGKLFHHRHFSCSSGMVHFKNLNGAIHGGRKINFLIIAGPEKTIDRTVPLRGQILLYTILQDDNVIFIGFISRSFHLQPSQGSIL